MKTRTFTLKLIFALFALSLPIQLAAQKETKKAVYSFSGYAQAQYEYGDPYATLSVGEPNKDLTQGFGRFGIRRALLENKVQLGSFTFIGTINVTERSVLPFHLYAKWGNPYGANKQSRYYVAAGLQTVNFGLEQPESSATRIAPDRSEFFDDLTPSNIDLMVSAGTDIGFNIEGRNMGLKLDGALLSGNGMNAMRKSIPDGLLRVELYDKTDPFDWLVGASGYYGYVLNEDATKRVSRHYYNAFLELGVRSSIGRTALRGEFIGGVQPGTLTRNALTGPKSSADINEAVFTRDFLTFMLQLEHLVYIGDKISFTPYLKYAFYDRNKNLAGQELATAILAGNASSIADTKTQSLGGGIKFEYGNFSVTPYYEWRTNETVAITGNPYAHDRQDNRFTFRLQYIF